MSYPQTVNIKAIAIKAGDYDSGIFSETYTAVKTVDVPQANRTINTITFTVNPTDAEIYYTIDESQPTVGSTKYTSGIVITQTTTIKAIAIKTGWETSGLFNQTYEFVAKPNVVRTGDKVAISTVTSGASLYYTIDGGALTAYTEPVTVKTNTVITAIAKKNGVDSEGFEGSFTATYNKFTYIWTEGGNTNIYTLVDHHGWNQLVTYIEDIHLNAYLSICGAYYTVDEPIIWVYLNEEKTDLEAKVTLSYVE